MVSEVPMAAEVSMAAEVPMFFAMLSANMRSTADVRNADVSTYDKSPLQLPTSVTISLLPLQFPTEVPIITCLIYIAYDIIATAGILARGIIFTYYLVSVAYDPDIFFSAAVYVMFFVAYPNAFFNTIKCTNVFLDNVNIIGSS
jgi:hypothetical protein